MPRTAISVFSKCNGDAMLRTIENGLAITNQFLLTRESDSWTL